MFRKLLVRTSIALVAFLMLSFCLGTLRAAMIVKANNTVSLALCLVAAVGFLGFGLRTLRNAETNSISYFFHSLKGPNVMRKCLLPLATLAALAAASAARADLLDFNLVPDGVYTSQAAYQDWLSNQMSTDILSTATISGQTVNLPFGTTSGYVTMAIVATINNGTSVAPISGDGIAWAYLNIVGTTSGNMGTGVLENPIGAAALVNGGGLVGNQTGQANPGANNGAFGNTTQYWQTIAASPVQSYAGTSTHTSAGSNYYKRPIEWPENFVGTNPAVTGGINTSPMVIGVAGSAPEASTDVASNFTAIYSPPTIPTNARLVTYSTPTSYTVSSLSSANGTAIQPGSGASAYLLGASGINANTATFILGEVDYSFSALRTVATRPFKRILPTSRPSLTDQMQASSSTAWRFNLLI